MARDKRVIMAEKRDAAEDIAKAIGLKDITREGASGFIHGRDADGDEIVVTWSNGHCLELPEPDDIDEKYKKWNVYDLPLPLDSDMELKIIKGKEKLFYDIKKELADADNIVNAGDAGREGELIQRWIIRQALKGKPVNVSRLWIQSLTEKSIRDSYENGLIGISKEEQKTLDNLYDSGRARIIMDKYIGYNYSRLISLTQTEGVTVNYGRCKSPLVHAIVERDMEIENFVSVPFSYLKLNLEKDGCLFSAFLVGEDKKRQEFTKDREDELKNITDNLPLQLSISDISIKDKMVMPPQPYDTLQMQKEMASKHGFEASKTLEIMEKLYNEYHILSYPRTEARYYTTDLKEDLKAVLRKLAFGEFKPFVDRAMKSFIPDKYFNNKKIADHHALAPVCEGSIEEVYNKLTDDERKIYDAVIKNFIALHLPGYEYESTEAIAKCGENLFLIKGKKDKTLGYKELYHDERKEKDDDEEEKGDQVLPMMNAGDSVKITEKEIVSSKTKPKSRFTTSSLLDFMKVNNIGTGATRDRIIAELTEKKGFNKEASVERDGKFYVSTALGRAMDEVIPGSLKSIDYLKYLERRIQDIADGNLDLEAFLKQMSLEFDTNLSEMKENRSAKLVSEVNVNNVVPDMACPVCSSPLKDVGWGYSCSEWKKDGSGCNFAIGKKQYNKTLPENAIKQLLSDQITKTEIKGLKGKSGKAFSAKLALEISAEGKAIIRPVFK